MFFWQADRAQLNRIEDKLDQLLDLFSNIDPTANTERWNKLMATLEELTAADDELDAAVNDIVAKLDELNANIVSLQDQITQGIQPAQLDAEVAELQRKTTQIRDALAPPPAP